MLPIHRAAFAIVAIGAGAGCDQIFPISAPEDAAPEPDAAGDNDRDRDGVADDVDNCPDLPNADQDNEDNDPRGDDCDECPMDGSMLVVDADLDGVGDDCDLHRSTPGDSIDFFDGFASDSGAWNRQSGAWMLTGIDDLVEEETVGRSRILKTGAYLVSGGTELTVQARFVVRSESPPGTAGVLVDFTDLTPGNGGYVCGLRDDTVVTRGIYNTLEPSSALDTTAGGSTTVATSYRMDIIGIDRSCWVGRTSPVRAGTIPLGAAHAGIIGLYADNTRIALEWFVVYRFVP